MPTRPKCYSRLRTNSLRNVSVYVEVLFFCIKYFSKFSYPVMRSILMLLVVACCAVQMNMAQGKGSSCEMSPMCDEPCPANMYPKLDDDYCFNCECFNPCQGTSCPNGCKARVDEYTVLGDPIYVAVCQ
ncbi:hypothetical protein HELRODRAFT_177108 [Helobdella robusta]|uniref:Uncharacterized protein n=1 Tax=Helobdella robusta TaxID=6412 RepID=T1FB84_HELRO|nr:hypothetical protein HELRODRAFT_177108 [Helobdella robusta]ESN98229.1 hypothetical protein HELRODRAFT_177108 [Helobdella robusta]